MGQVGYGQGVTQAGLAYQAIFAEVWTPEELEAIAKDLREQTAVGGVFHSERRLNRQER